jgi:hypothetical protein
MPQDQPEDKNWTNNKHGKVTQDRQWKLGKQVEMGVLGKPSWTQIL